MVETYKSQNAILWERIRRLEHTVNKLEGKTATLIDLNTKLDLELRDKVDANKSLVRENTSIVLDKDAQINLLREQKELLVQQTSKLRCYLRTTDEFIGSIRSQQTMFEMQQQERCALQQQESAMASALALTVSSMASTKRRTQTRRRTSSSTSSSINNNNNKTSKTNATTTTTSTTKRKRVAFSNSNSNKAITTEGGSRIREQVKGHSTTTAKRDSLGGGVAAAESRRSIATAVAALKGSNGTAQGLGGRKGGDRNNLAAQQVACTP